MERRAKLKVARWAGPVVGSLLMSGCGGNNVPAPTAETTLTLAVEMPQIQEFGGSRPLGAEDYRSAGAVQTQFSVPEWGSAPAVQAAPAESGPVSTLPNSTMSSSMPSGPQNSVPWNSPAQNGPGYDQTAPGISISELANPQTTEPGYVGPAIEADSVSIDEYLASRAKMQGETEAPPTAAVEPVPTVASPEMPSSSVAVESLPAWPSNSELPPIYSPTTADRLPAAEQPAVVERVPEWPPTRVVESAPPPVVESLPSAVATSPLPAVETAPMGTPPIGTPLVETAPVQTPPVTTADALVPTLAPVQPQVASTSAAPQVPAHVYSVPPRSPFGAAPMQPVRTPEMNGVAREAERCNGRGFDLATRGAVMAARREFIEALRLIALQLDKDGETKHYTQSLAAGLAALDEADDFSPRGSRLDVELDLTLLVRGHRTPVLKEVDVKDLSPLVAAGRYYAYAQHQLGMAAGHEMAGSLALYGLGKVHDMIHEQRMPKFNSPLLKAMVYHQAALTTDPRNFRAANDLGVLLARTGRLEIAKAMLLHSVNVTSQPAVWRNLAVIHEQLGETQLSARARQLAAASQKEGEKAFPPGANPNTSRFAVRWVDPETFAASSRATGDLQQPTPTNPPTALNNLPMSPPKTAKSWSPFGSPPTASAPAQTSKGFFR